MIAFGDLAEACLARIGITKERFQAWTGITNCGCAGRRDAMNRWGYMAQAAVFVSLQSLHGWWRNACFRFVPKRVAVACRLFLAGIRVLLFGT